MRRWLIILFTFFCFGLSELSAQPQLALLKNDRIVTRFTEGEYIRFQRKGESDYIRAMITGIHPGYFMLGVDTIYHYEVAKVDVSKKTLTGFKVAPIGKGLMIGGASLFLIDAFNTTVIQNQSYSLDTSVARVGFILIGTGALMQLVNNNYFKTGRKKKLASLNL